MMRTIDAMAGEALANHRQGLAMTRPEMSREMRHRGLLWTPQIVANSEAGARSLRLAELIVLADFFGSAPLNLIAPLPSHGYVRVTDNFALPTHVIANMLGA